MCNISRLHIAIPSSVGRPATVAGIQILVAYNSIFAHHGWVLPPLVVVVLQCFTCWCFCSANSWSFFKFWCRTSASNAGWCPSSLAKLLKLVKSSRMYFTGRLMISITILNGYPLPMYHAYEPSPFLIGKWFINGAFSTAMLKYQRVIHTSPCPLGSARAQHGPLKRVPRWPLLALDKAGHLTKGETMIFLDWDFPWNQSSILDTPHDYGNPQI